MITVRRAGPADAGAMSEVLVASIRELCTADHRGDPAILAGWLANKTPDRIAQWLTDPAGTILVAERNGEIAAVGGVSAAREITLNYVAPAHRFAGVSTALLGALEAALGPGPATLTSTATAHPFYRARGWSDAGGRDIFAGMTVFPMRKMLV